MPYIKCLAHHALHMLFQRYSMVILKVSANNVYYVLPLLIGHNGFKYSNYKGSK